MCACVCDGGVETTSKALMWDDGLACLDVAGAPGSFVEISSRDFGQRGFLFIDFWSGRICDKKFSRVLNAQRPRSCRDKSRNNLKSIVGFFFRPCHIPLPVVTI